MTFARLFARGFLIVTLTALNVTQIAAQHYPGALAVGMAISWVWWGNSGRAAHVPGRWAQAAYASGAGAGTVVGMLIGRWLT